MNRPRALNALDIGMIRGIQAAIDAWRDDAAVKLVLLEGAGGKAFCAGGDVRGIRDAAIAGDAASIEAFFSEEYAMNRGIARFGKPWVSSSTACAWAAASAFPCTTGRGRDRERPPGDARDRDRVLPGRRHLPTSCRGCRTGSARGWR
jgi:hypothetical protein